MKNKSKEKVIMKSEVYPYNMDTWCIEKSGRALKSLAYISEMVKSTELVFKDEDSMEHFNMLYLDALRNVSKMYGFSCGEILDKDYSNLILEKGMYGLEEIMFEFGQIKETTSQVKKRKCKDLIESLKLNIKDSYINRTLIHESLRTYRNNVKDVRKEILDIENNTEKVTMGEIKVEDFIIKVKPIIEKLDKELNS